MLSLGNKKDVMEDVGTFRYSVCVCVFPTSRKVWPFTWEDGVELIAHFHHSDDFIRFQTTYMK